MHPASPKKEPKTPPKNWQSLFLAALGETSNVTAAAHAAQISPSRAYKARRTDPDFKRRWMAALCEGYDNLEMDLLCWLRTGKVESLLEQNGNIEEPKAASEPAATAESGKKAGKSAKSAQPAARTPERKFDAATALRVLAAHREAVGREKGRQTLEDEGQLIAAIDSKIDAMQARDKAARRLARQSRAGGRPSRAA
jgi:hypothetical protein